MVASGQDTMDTESNRRQELLDSIDESQSYLEKLVAVHRELRDRAFEEAAGDGYIEIVAGLDDVLMTAIKGVGELGQIVLGSKIRP